MQTKINLILVFIDDLSFLKQFYGIKTTMSITKNLKNFDGDVSIFYALGLCYIFFKNFPFN